MLIVALYAILIFATPADTISHRITFSENQLAFTTIQDYDYVELDGTLSILSPGYPSLPRKSLIFAIPAGSRVVCVESEVINSQVISGTYLIYPSQPQVYTSSQDSVVFTLPDSAIYSRITPWPPISATGSELGTLDMTELARVDVFPVIWNPGTGQLSLRKTIDLRVILEADTVPAPSAITMTNTGWERRIEMLKSIVVNPDSITVYSVQPTLVSENTKGTDDFPIALEYVIITRAAWKDAWQPLVNWNIRRGLFTEVVTLEEIENLAGTFWAEGRDWPETVRNCIRWQHEQRGAQYILLGTDTSPLANGNGIYSEDEVPMRYCKLYKEMTNPSNYTDWYYSCLDALFNWQTNSNPWWGEYYPPDNPNVNDLLDLIPDVAVGRIPVHSVIEAREAAMSIVAYQKHKITSAAPSSDLLIVSGAASIGGFPETWQHLEEIISVVPSYFGVQWIAEYTCNLPFAIDINPQLVLDHLDGTAVGGGYYRVNFGGHGGSSWIGANPEGDVGNFKVWSSDLHNMSGSDGKYCTGYAFNCLTGQFVNSSGNQSILETWLGADEQLNNAPLGPGYIGNTVQALNSSDLAGSTSHNLNQWYLDALYNDIPSLGSWGNADAYNIASIEYAGSYLAGYPFIIPPPIVSGNVTYEPMWDLKVSNLGGDPALPVWLKEPIQMVSHYPSQLSCPDYLIIDVETTGGVAMSGVRVCLLMEATNGFEVYIRGFTDSSGEFIAYLDPSFSGRMFVTLTKQGYLPDEGEVRLIAE